LLVEDKPGLLTRVVGSLARRGFNIESPRWVRARSLTLPHNRRGALRKLPEQVTKQLNKLINVKIVELDPTCRRSSVSTC
jgi:acetolactate synthase small subunit